MTSQDPPARTSGNTHPAKSSRSSLPLPNPSASPVKETPSAIWESPERWAVVDAFGADPTGEADSAAAIRRAIASGASTLFFPGSYKCGETIEIGGKVRSVIGLGGSINYGKRDLINFRIVNGDPYTTLVRETRGDETRELPATNHHTAPYSGR